jgi:hypothetical protein
MLESYATLAYGARMLVVLPSTKHRVIRNAIDTEYVYSKLGLCNAVASSEKRAIDEDGEETGIPDEFSLREYFKRNKIHSANARARGDAKNKQVTPVCISHIYSTESFNRSILYKSPTVVLPRGGPGIQITSIYTVLDHFILGSGQFHQKHNYF